MAEARQGHAVALVGSGDVGVYAMASPALAIAGTDIDVTGVPGITAGLAAAALLGAPLGHDHAIISLSDLHTPWEIIERRIRAAAEGDFVVAFYNPRSKERDWQLGAALEILAGHRDPGTPAGVVHDAFRPGQRVLVTTLAETRPGRRGHEQRGHRRLGQHPDHRGPDGHAEGVPMAVASPDPAAPPSASPDPAAPRSASPDPAAPPRHRDDRRLSGLRGMPAHLSRTCDTALRGHPGRPGAAMHGVR